MRQPSSQVKVAALQYCPRAQVSLVGTHCTQRPEAVSHTGRAGSVQSALVMQRATSPSSITSARSPMSPASPSSITSARSSGGTSASRPGTSGTLASGLSEAVTSSVASPPTTEVPNESQPEAQASMIAAAPHRAILG